MKQPRYRESRKLKRVKTKKEKLSTAKKTSLKEEKMEGKH